ncbi:BREX system ATP-binding domain-containing protein [Micromonospora zhanjiangensis]
MTHFDHFAALSFLQGLLTVLRDSGHPGLLLVLDEVETLQRVRSDARDKALNALRQLIDEVHSGRFPGLYLVITGTPAFYDGPQGVQRLAPLAQRLAVDFSTEARFDNPRAVQIRLPGFTVDSLVELGGRVRDLYVTGSTAPDRVRSLADDGYLRQLAEAVAGGLGGKVGIAPRLFLKKLVGDVLDRIDQFPDFDPRRHYALTLSSAEMSDVERNATRADEISLDV